MSQLTVEQKQADIASNGQAHDQYATWRWYLLPLIFSFAVELLTPQLIGWRMVPRAVIWLSDMAIAAMIVIVIMRMLLLDRIPKVFLLVLAVTMIGVTVALFEGQNLTITAYGLRRLFQYPLVGLYVYMMPQWPPWSAKWLMRICLAILALNVLFQIGQIAAGGSPGDFLAGTFGPHGVGPLINFIVLVISFGYGKWLANGDWRYLISALALGALASSLGLQKMFPLVVLILALLAFFLQLFRGGQLRRLIIIIIVLAVGLVAFVYAFNSMSTSIKRREVQDYLDVSVLSEYLGGVSGGLDIGYRLNRNTEPLYVWQNNLKSTSSFLFGKGIGSRAQSSTLGLSGTWYDTSFYTGGPGRSLPVLLQETGIVGLMALAAFIVAAIFALSKKAASNGKTDLAAVQYGLLLFSALWPLLLWYQPVWIQAVPMLLYWAALGFALNDENNVAVQEYYGVD